MTHAHATATPTAAAPGPARAPGPLPAALRLQRAAGNYAVGQLLQAQLELGSPHDPAEREADRMADAAVSESAPAPPAGARETGPSKGPEVSRAPAGGAGATGPAPPIVHAALAAPGAPLPAPAAGSMSARLGRDFSAVRVHTDGVAAESARAIGARAYAVGTDVVFGAGQFAPDTTTGRRLLAHELAHVAQQGGAVVRRDPAPAASPPAPAPAPGPPVPAPAPGPSGSVGGSDVLPSAGEARIRLSEGMTFPLATGDLSEFKIGLGEKSTGELPLGESGLVTEILVGADNPLRLVGQQLEISPLVVKIKAEEIATRKQERETAVSRGGVAGAASGGIVGGVIGGLAGLAIAGPLGAIAGARAGAAEGGVIGGKLGERALGAITAEQKFTAELEQASITAKFPLVYNPYLKLSVAPALGLSNIGKATVTLQTNLQLAFSLSVSLGSHAKGGGTRLELFFRDGRLSRAAFTLALTGGLDVTLNAFGMLRGSIIILPILGDEHAHGAPGAIDVHLFESEVFDIIKNHGVSFETTANVTLATGSAVGKKGHTLNTTKGKSLSSILLDLVKGKGVGGQYDQLAKRTKKGGGKAPDPDDSHSGEASDPIPIIWYKPLKLYMRDLRGIKGRKVAILRYWPHQEYFAFNDEDYEPGESWWVGIDTKNLPKKGKPLVRTKSGSRTEADKWKARAAKYDVSFGDAEVDHVHDLAFGGPDHANNLWPVPKADHKRASEATWQQTVWFREKGEPEPRLKTSVSFLPSYKNLHLVIIDIQDPP